MNSPRLIGPYRILGELGRGGMGVVYAAHDTQLGRDVALKVILADPASNPDSLQRFEREALAMAGVQHPNVVAIYAVVRLEGRPCLAMEFVKGESLRGRIDRTGALPTDEAARIMAAVARGVEAAHAHGVLHRDLKPDNVLLDEAGRPRLTDFGLAKRAEDERLTLTGSVLGTPAYMPPEQAGVGKPDVRSDVYGVGATLYACLTGQPPFRGESVLNVLTRVVSDPPTPPRDLNPNVDPVLEAICLKAIEKDPARRYPTAAALAEALEQRIDPGHRARASVGRWLAVLVLLGVVGVGLAVLQPGSNSAQPDATAAPTDPPTPSPTPAVAHGKPPNLRGLEPAAKRDRLTPWLAENSTHPQAPRLRARLAELWRTIPRLELRHPTGARSAVFVRGGIVTAGGGALVLWDRETGRELWRHTASFAIDRAVPTPSGDACLVTGNPDHRLLWITFPDRTVRPIVPSEPIRLIKNLNVAALSLDGRRALLGDDHARAITLLDVPSGRVVKQYELGRPLRKAVFLNDSDTIAVLRWATKAPWELQIRRVGSDQIQQTPILEHPYYLRRLGPQGHVAIAHIGASPTGDRSGWLKTFDTRGAQVRVLTPGQQLVSSHASEIHGLACSPDGRWIATATSPPTPVLRLWDVHKDDPVLHEVPHSGVVRWLEFSPDGHQLLQLNNPSDPIFLWDLGHLKTP